MCKNYTGESLLSTLISSSKISKLTHILFIEWKILKTNKIERVLRNKNANAQNSLQRIYRKLYYEKETKKKIHRLIVWTLKIWKKTYQNRTCPLLFNFASKVRCWVRVLNLDPNPISSYALLLICMVLNFRQIRSQYFIPVKFDKYELFGYDCIIEM